MSVPPSQFEGDPSLLDMLVPHSVPVPCEGYRVLFRQGEQCSGLYIVQEGEATLEMRSNTGDDVVQYQATRGSLLGLPAILGNRPYSLTAIAAEGSKVRFINRSDLIALMAADPSLSLKVIQVLAAEIGFARSEIASLISRESP